MNDSIGDDILELLLVSVGDRTHGVGVGWLSGKHRAPGSTLLARVRAQSRIVGARGRFWRTIGRVYDVLKSTEGVVVGDDGEVAPLQISTKLSDSQYNG